MVPAVVNQADPQNTNASSDLRPESADQVGSRAVGFRIKSRAFENPTAWPVKSDPNETPGRWVPIEKCDVNECLPVVSALSKHWYNLESWAQQ
jgi:hypothetical protein